MSASIETPGASARRPSGDRATADFGASANISRVPYMPGLDGMRALAVVTVMIYHANSTWLKGGFLGVEVFFVISGYLITLLLISEHEREPPRRHEALLDPAGPTSAPAAVRAALLADALDGALRTVDARQAARRHRRRAVVRLELVPGVHRPGVQRGERLRPAAPPLEPRGGGAVLPDLADRDGAAPARRQPRDRRAQPLAVRCGAHHHVLVALLYHQGPIGTNEVTPEAYWHSSGATSPRPTSSTCRPSPAPAGCCSARPSPWSGGRSPSCADRCVTAPRCSTAFGAAGLAVLGLMMWSVGFVGSEGADPLLFRGGFFLSAIATLAVIAAVTHPAHPDVTGARHAVPGVDRRALVRAVPLPLADLPAHPQHRRQAHEVPRVRDRHRPHGRRDRTLVPLRRDADPQGRARRLVEPDARQSGPRSAQRRARWSVRRHGTGDLRRDQPGDRRAEAERRAAVDREGQ